MITFSPAENNLFQKAVIPGDFANGSSPRENAV